MTSILSSLRGNDAFWNSESALLARAASDAALDPELERMVNASKVTRTLVYFRTSGSEGAPKWVGLSRAALLASAKAVNDHLESTHQDRWIVALPLHHVGGFSILARCHVSGASWSELPGRWEAETFTRQCEREEITLASLVPTQVYDLVQNGLAAPSTLRAIVVGGGGLNREVALRALALGWPVLQSFGMTETASQVATEPLEHLLTGFDPDSLEILEGWEVQTDEQDRLTVRGPALASGYLTFLSGKWTWAVIEPAVGVVTRDRVQTWRHGRRQYLRFLGREATFVKVLGELVSLPELQARLERLCLEAGHSPASCVIWTVPDARQETRLVLVGELPVTVMGDLRQTFNAQVTGFQRLTQEVAVRRIPRTPLGKVDRVAMDGLIKG